MATACGVKTEIREGAELGVWSLRGQTTGRATGKIAAVGIHVEAGVLLHGLSLNVYRTPQSFVGLKPCGLDAEVDFLSPRPDPEFFLKVKDLLIEEALSAMWSA